MAILKIQKQELREMRRLVRSLTYDNQGND